VLDETTLHRVVPILVDLAVGALVGGACFDLLPEAVSRHASAVIIGLGLVVGYIGFAVFDRVLRVTATAATSERALFTLNMTGDLLHNFVDGALVTVSFLAGPAIGVVAAVAIALHEVPRELGSLAIFLHAGLPRGRAIALNALTSVSAFAGAGLTLSIGTHVNRVAGDILPIAAGTFIYLARAIVQHRSGHAIRIPLFVTGVIVTALAARLG